MDLFQSRRLVIQGTFIIVILVFLLRLFYMQVIDENYKQLANSNSLRRVTVYPARGLIYDRKQRLILYNKAEYDLMVIPLQVPAFDTVEFARVLNVDVDYVKKTLIKAHKTSPYKPFLFLKGIQAEQFQSVRESLFQFAGFYSQVRTVRSYPYLAAAHVLGYIGEVSPKQLEKLGSYYRQGDYIGITGIEESYEEILRGNKGVRYMLVDVNNREQGSFAEGKFDTIASPGLNLVSSIDVELQQYGEKLMQNKIGSLVAIDPSTGEVLAMVSSPSYDPSLLSGKDRGKNFKILYADPNKPLFNRAIKAPYPPGSTFKPLMAAIGMEEKVIQPWAGFSMCHGGINIGSLHIGCHPHAGIPNVCVAIAVSCNGYFAHYFREVIDNRKNHKDIAAGLDAWNSYLKKFGLGIKTGIDLPNEGYGFAPDSKYYTKRYKTADWRSSMIVSIGFGQGELSATPLQIVNMMCAFANRGYWFTPHLVKKIQNDSTTLKSFIKRHDTGIDTAICNIVIKGMEDVVEAGTARIAKIPGISICGKTGTAQNPHGKDHSLFACFAPKDNPKIALAVIVENSGFGATWAAPIASLMIEKYLNDSIAPNRKYLEQRMFDGNLIKPIPTPEP
jgi:penicillin-binding protein 2